MFFLARVYSDLNVIYAETPFRRKCYLCWARFHDIEGGLSSKGPTKPSLHPGIKRPPIKYTPLMITAGPTLERQLGEFCLPQSQNALRSGLGAAPYSDANCKTPVLPGTSPASCGQVCEKRLPLLQDFGGCSSLAYLCNKDETSTGKPKLLQRF